MARKKDSNDAKDGFLKLGVTFKGVSSNKALNHASIGCNISQQIPIAKLHKEMTGARLDVECEVTTGGEQDAEGQATIEEAGVTAEFEAVADCLGITTRTKVYMATLKFCYAEIDIDKLNALSGGRGTLWVKRTGNAVEDKAVAEEEAT